MKKLLTILAIVSSTTAFANTAACPAIAGNYSNCSYQGISLGDEIKIAISQTDDRGADLYDITIQVKQQDGLVKTLHDSVKGDGSVISIEQDTAQGHLKATRAGYCDNNEIVQKIQSTMDGKQYLDTTVSFGPQGASALLYETYINNQGQIQHLPLTCQKL